MKTLAATNEWINVKSIGKSTEGVDTFVIQILKAGKHKPTIWIEAGFKFITIIKV